MTFSRPFDPEEDRFHFDWYWKHFFATTAPHYRVKGDISGLVRTLIRNGLSHAFIAKPGIEITKYDQRRHMTAEEPLTLTIDCTQFATDFRRSYETRVRPILEGTPVQIKSHPVSLQTMQDQFDLMAQHYAQEANACFAQVSGLVLLESPSPFSATTASANFPAGGTITIANIASKSPLE